jgi:acid stress-induced BolA-like protein IbaG/YrbA
MNKKAKEAIKAKLVLDQHMIRGKLSSNRYAMEKLVEEQTRLKRELAIYQDLIRSLEDKQREEQ